MPIIETVPFNFAELHDGLATQFQDAGYDTSAGSNVSQLVTAMAYFTSMLNVNTAVNINEMVLPLASSRNNVLADARALGYEIQHKQSYRYRLLVTLSGHPNGEYTIPKYSKFTDGNKDYYYMGAPIELINQPDGRQLEIAITEGTLYRYQDYPNSLTTTTIVVTNEAGQSVPQYYVDIPFVDVEDNSIECFITYYDDFGNLVTNEEWLKSEQFMIDKDLIIKNKFFRMDDIEYKTPRIYFELAGVGAGIRLGSTVNINVLTTSGAGGALLEPSNPAKLNHTIPNMVISSISTISEGTDEESIKSIKDNAPKFYNSANRAVTASDYKAICNRQASVTDSQIWGGDEELPKVPGHIWMSFLPSNYQRNFTLNTAAKEYKLDLHSYTDWDYTLTESPDPVNLPGPFEAQLAAAEATYSMNYMEDAEVRSRELNSDGRLINPGIWDVLENFKIPTIEFHQRHPIFLDFEYDIEVLKYDVVSSKSTVNDSVFNIIDNFFTGTNESLNIESFEVDYFNSSLGKRIDLFLTDRTGYNANVSTKLLISKQNVTQENLSQNYRDVYIPLDTPFETHFDLDGYLMYDVLPKITTDAFIDYRTIADRDAGINIPQNQIYVDWSGIQAEIDAGIKQVGNPLIIAPVRIHQSEIIDPGVLAPLTVSLTNIEIWPDDPSVWDLDPTNVTYDKTVVTLVNTVTGAETILQHGTGANMWSMTDQGVSAQDITLTTSVNGSNNEVLRIETESACGDYILFNSFKKYITVQLFVDAINYVDNASLAVAYDTPKSYLTTLDELYDYTIDTYYVTTNGYSLNSPAQVDPLTGNIVKAITPTTYAASPIKMDLFRRDRYLTLAYNSPNFAVKKNVIPRLTRVTFK